MENPNIKTLGQDLYKAHVLTRNTLSKELKDFNITVEQWNVVKHLSEREGCNQKDLAKRCLKDRAALTRILDILEKKDIIKRKSSPNDRREFLIFLTSIGKKTFSDISPIMNATASRNFNNFTFDEIDNLKSLLDKLISNLD